MSTAARLAEWCAQRGIALSEVDEQTICRFVRLRRRSRRGNGRDQTHFRACKFLRHLRESGVAPSVVASRQPEHIIELAAWMRERRGLAESTVVHILRVVRALLLELGEAPSQWSAATIRDFVLRYVRAHAPHSAGSVTTSVRCFLRYLIVLGRCAPELVDAVPKVPGWRMARLPRYLPSDDVERVIAASGGQRGTVLRNRAILLLLARLGLRSHEVVGLRLGDLNWRQARLSVRGKGGRETCLPLPQDVGDAILGYLQKERPAATTDYLFLYSRGPIRPLGTSGLRDVVGRAIVSSGVKAPFRGPHLLRHSLATRLLHNGAALDTIGAVLRHRNVDTTALYAKVDLGLLRQVAQPWPIEVSPC